LELKICEKGKKCLHFRIKELVGSLKQRDKVKPEQLPDFRQRIKEIGKLVREFEKEITEKFNPKTRTYSCIDPMQIAWGRRAFRAEIQRLKEIKIIQKKNHSFAKEVPK